MRRATFGTGVVRRMVGVGAVAFVILYAATHWDGTALSEVTRSIAEEDPPAHAEPSPHARGHRSLGQKRAPASRHEASAAPGHVTSAADLQGAPNVMLGIPADADPSDDLLLDEEAFVVSYNPVREAPNWVAWRLDRSTLGAVPRRDDFRPDPALPVGLHRVTPEEYAHTGFDRGHLCPSGDRDESPEDNSRTFVMTNMLPQVHELNAGPWEKLERYERELAQRRSAELYIVAGGVWGAHPRAIGSGVAVPNATFKVIVALTTGATANDVREDTPVIAAIMPNDHAIADAPWRRYATTVSEVEKATGYTFLSNVPANVRAVLESKRAADD